MTTEPREVEVELSDLRVVIDRMVESMQAAAAAFSPWPVRVVVGNEVEPSWMEMRRLGAAEKAAAVEWLNGRLDQAYADLGMVRDPHITRGAE